jgi:hypothetical protein
MNWSPTPRAPGVVKWKPNFGNSMSFDTTCAASFSPLRN